MRYALWIAFAVLLGLAGLVPCFIDEMTWARGGGDFCLVVFGILMLILIWWERSIRARSRK